MLLFPIYAAMVWYACYRWRRRFLGWAAYGAGVAGILLLLVADIRLMRLVFNQTPAPSFLLLLGAEAVMVAVIGLLVVTAPRERPVVPCRACGYELDGLDDPNPRCPECGTAEAAKRRRGPIHQDPPVAAEA